MSIIFANKKDSELLSMLAPTDPCKYKHSWTVGYLDISSIAGYYL